MNIRKATLGDIELLIRLRMDFLTEEFGGLSPRRKEELAGRLGPYFETHLRDRSFIAMIAEAEGEAVATAYMAISEMPAGPSFMTGRVGTVLNVWTCPQHRRKGIAARVLGKLIDEARLLDVSSVRLSATEAGRGLYQKLGFRDSKYPYMSLEL